MKVVRLSALRTGHLYPQEIFLVLISVTGYVEPRDHSAARGSCQSPYPPAASSQGSGSIRCATPRPKLKYTLTTILHVVLQRREAWSLTLREHRLRPYERENRDLWRKFGSKKDVVNR
jgi:hypothetical protein